MPSARSPYAIEVGARLATAREAAGFKQVELARRLGITPQKLANYEKGTSVLPPALVGKIYLLTRINSDWLYLGDPSRLPADVFGRMFPEARNQA